MHLFITEYVCVHICLSVTATTTAFKQFRHYLSSGSIFGKQSTQRSQPLSAAASACVIKKLYMYVCVCVCLSSSQAQLHVWANAKLSTDSSLLVRFAPFVCHGVYHLMKRFADNSMARHTTHMRTMVVTIALSAKKSTQFVCLTAMKSFAIPSVLLSTARHHFIPNNNNVCLPRQPFQSEL